MIYAEDQTKIQQQLLYIYMYAVMNIPKSFLPAHRGSKKHVSKEGKAKS